LLVALPDLAAGHMAEHDRRDGAKQPEDENCTIPQTSAATARLLVFRAGYGAPMPPSAPSVPWHEIYPRERRGPFGRNAVAPGSCSGYGNPVPG
jgi:hypothetical protein